MPSIINGLFSGRSGISSHGTAIAVIGDNIANGSTLGYKASRSEFSDLLAGGQTSGKTVGSGSQLSAISTVFEQGTLEFTSRPLDLAIDGNGFFVAKNTDGSRVYTRAGNFKVDSAGFITTQGDLRVQGFPANGSGALDDLNINNISQDSVATTAISISGNIERDATTVATASIPATLNAGAVGAQVIDYGDLASDAAFSVPVEIFDSLGAKHTATFYMFHDPSTPNIYNVRGYVNSDEVGDAANPGLPRLILDSTSSGNFTMTMGPDGLRSDSPTGTDKTYVIPWGNGSAASTVTLNMESFTSYASKSNIDTITQDGKGVGAVTSISIEKNGDIFALLSNGQSSVIGSMGMVNFSNPEGLSRIGNQLLQQSASSGEPIVGKALTGTLGSISSGAVELSTVDIADQFVKLITLQRGFQANSRIITTINQLLNELIQLA